MPHKWDPICQPPKRLVRPVRTDRLGVTGPTPEQARGRRWRRTSHGHYVPSWVEPDVPEQRVLEQSVRLPAGGAVTGWAALRLHRAGFFDGLAVDGSTQLPVPLAVGPRGKLRGDHKVALSREPLGADEIVVLHGIPCTRVRRAVFDEMRRPRDLRSAVVAMDMAAAALLTSIRRMRDYWLDHRSWRRASLVGEALGLASEDSKSPQETRYRLVWVLDAGLPPPLVNQPVWDRDGNLLGIADLLDEEAGLVGEFDGADHRTATGHTRDLRGSFVSNGMVSRSAGSPGSTSSTGRGSWIVSTSTGTVRSGCRSRSGPGPRRRLLAGTASRRSTSTWRCVSGRSSSTGRPRERASCDRPAVDRLHRAVVRRSLAVLRNRCPEPPFATMSQNSW